MSLPLEVLGSVRGGTARARAGPRTGRAKRLNQRNNHMMSVATSAISAPAPSASLLGALTGKLDDLLAQATEDRITIRLQSQPWRMYSGVIVRCILAASALKGGKAARRPVATHPPIRLVRQRKKGDARRRRPSTLGQPSVYKRSEGWRSDRQVRRRRIRPRPTKPVPNSASVAGSGAGAAVPPTMLTEPPPLGSV